jgi:chromosome segregation protein
MERMSFHQKEKSMVYIKKITTKGFKSYGNRTVSVTFSKNFTSIVGPNGSGKSNIIDAISFVLGRLSTKSMRAVVLSDLIFTGSKKMNPAKYAEVSLYLDNSHGELPFDRKQVIISRSVDTSGKSVYRVNRKRETRTYVVDILSQIGVFPEGHNIIMQGDITRFIKMSSWERRGVIEEISGIAEYSERRERGDRELAKAEDNIARVELVLNEVQKQMERLETEKNDALRYKFLKDEILTHKGWLYKGELKNAEERFEKTLEAIEKTGKEIRDSQDKIGDCIESIAQKEEQFELIDSEIEKLGEEKHLSITKEIERLRGELNTIQQGISFFEDQKSSIETQKHEAEETIRKDDRTLEEKTAHLENLETGKTELIEKIASLKEEYQKHLSVLSETGLETLERITQDLDEKKDAFFSLEASAEILENTITTLTSSHAEHHQERVSLEEQQQNLHTQVTQTQQELTNTTETITRIEETYASLEEERKSIKQELSTIDEDFLKKRSESIRLHSKLRAFQEDQRATPYKAVNTILKEKDRISGIYGTISQLGETKAQYQTALEVAAGNRVHNIVVDSTETARECIYFLKQKKAGRATFLPLDRLERKSHAPVKKEGIIDYAINLVNFDPRFRAAFEYVFSDTLVVETLEIDIKGARLVTLEGDVYERGGAVTGGHYFKRKFSSAFLISEDQKQFKKIQEELQSLKTRKNTLQDRLSVITPQLQELYDEKIKLEERLPSLQKDLQRISDDAATVASELEEINNKLSSMHQDLEEKKNKLSRIITEKEILSDAITHLEKEKDEISGPLRQDELARIESELENTRNALKGVEQDITQTTSTLAYVEEDIEKRKKDIALFIPRLADMEKNIASKTEEHTKITETLQVRIEEEESFDRKIRELRNKRTDIRDAVSRLRKEKEEVQKKMYKGESSLNVLNAQKNQLEEQVRELRDLVVQYPVEGEYEDLKELKFKIKQMEREKEGLEPINMRAVEEFEGVQERYITLKTRIDKLHKERESILEFIAEVESQKKTVFLEAYWKVAENFARIFAELSPGGSGTLSLEDEEDPFNGGLDIEASPQGKELKRVEAMSGGEKALTALAFVFAVQQYKPAPFYVFDEIDAHLDDENVARVSELIKRASENTQFIVITLRDVMMATADILYGVSMTEGISKIVSVELERIAEFKEPEEATITA